MQTKKKKKQQTKESLGLGCVQFKTGPAGISPEWDYCRNGEGNIQGPPLLDSRSFENLSTHCCMIRIFIILYTVTFATSAAASRLLDGWNMAVIPRRLSATQSRFDVILLLLFEMKWKKHTEQQQIEIYQHVESYKLEWHTNSTRDKKACVRQLAARLAYHFLFIYFFLFLDYLLLWLLAHSAVRLVEISTTNNSTKRNCSK